MLAFDPPVAQLRTLALQQGLGELHQVTLVKRQNDLWRLQTVQGTFYLKVYTKSWYGDDLAATSGCVQHELMAYELLSRQGLPVPGLRRGDLEGALLGRPFLLLSELPGLPLPTALREFPAEVGELLRPVGAFLAQMHALPFKHPGYLMSLDGPQQEPELLAWGHPLWTIEHLERAVSRELSAAELPYTLLNELVSRARALTTHLAPAYQPPRFTHGDCHASQFFLERTGKAWQVTGVLDLEVASAGAAEADFVKLALELRCMDFLEWWTPLFEGYGQCPDFERLRDWLLWAGEDSWQAHGLLDWPAELRRVLAARNWRDLLSPALP